MSDKIAIILTGGSIESVDSDSDFRKFKDNGSVTEYLKSLKPHFYYEIYDLMKKDSRDLNEEDRNEIIKQIQDCKENKVIISHGTYTMPVTADFLKNNSDKLEGKTIILTGSMIPLEGFWWTDAPFNLGFAIAHLDSEEPGVYLAMHGKISPYK